MHSSLAQNPQRDSHPTQELVPKLQVAGIPQIHPEHKQYAVAGTQSEKSCFKSDRTAKGSPQSQFVDVLLFNIKLSLRVAQWSRNLQTCIKLRFKVQPLHLKDSGSLNMSAKTFVMIHADKKKKKA